MFGYPETINYRAGYVASKSRKLADGRFEAVAAFFFNGIRRTQKSAIAETRKEAFKIVRASV
jgi:hypothetical protein